MNLSNITKKIRLFSLISFIIPLITLSSCLTIYKILGSYNLYANLDWDQIQNKVSVAEYKNAHKKINYNWTFTNCPKYKYTQYFIFEDDQIIPDNTPANTAIISKFLKKKKLKFFFFNN